MRENQINDEKMKCARVKHNNCRFCTIQLHNSNPSLSCISKVQQSQNFCFTLAHATFSSFISFSRIKIYYNLLRRKFNIIS